MKHPNSAPPQTRPTQNTEILHLIGAVLMVMPSCPHRICSN